MGSVRVSYYCVPFLLGKPGVKNPFPPKKCSDSPDCESQKFQFGFDPKNSLKVWIYGFMIRFWICLRNAPSVKLLARYVIEDVYKTWTPGTRLDLNHGSLGEPGLSTTHVDDP